jgi:ABC-2 type transport system ATP-binding protein
MPKTPARRPFADVIEAAGLGKRYGRTWGLRDCTLAVPAGCVTGLVGPNGSGKTTLLSLAVGMIRPTAGTVRVAGQTAGSPGARALTAFVAQDASLYQNLPVRDMLRVARNLNVRWDQDRAVSRLDGLGIPLKQRGWGRSGPTWRTPGGRSTVPTMPTPHACPPRCGSSRWAGW